MRIPNVELAVLAPAMAREAKRRREPLADAVLGRLLRAAHERGLRDVELEVHRILAPEYAEAAPTGSAAQLADSPEG